MEQFSDPNRARSIAKVRPRSNKHRPWSYLAGVVLALALLTSLFSSGAAADGTETLGEPSIPIASGNGTVAGGTGLIDQETGTITLDVPLGVSIEQVLLYWEGQAFTETSGFDDDIVVDGQTVEGVLIGGPTRFFSAAWSSTYRADITGLGLVDPGLNTIDVSGLDFDRRSNGAGILVITSDGGPNSTLAVRDGNDLAYIGFNPPLQSTIPQTVTFPPATTDRVATIDVFASSVAGDFEGERPNIILATVDGVVTQFDNVLNNTDGKEWDTVRLEVSIPAGATSLTLQLLSDDPATPNTGANPASLAWNAATFNIPTPREPGIDIEKLTNGNDADGANDGDVPEVAPGDPVTWTYLVTNTGDVAFAQSEVTVADDIPGVTPVFVASSDDGDGVLSPGETWTYEATGVADDLASPSVGTVIVDGCNPDGTTVPGDRATYENIGSVSVPGDSDSDPSHYCNPPDPGIDIEKLTNDAQADDADGADVPEVAPGDAVTWTYVVTNTGDVPFAAADVVVTDDVIGAITNLVDDGNGDGVLSPGEVWTYQATAPDGAADLSALVGESYVVRGCNPDGTTVPGDRATYENVGSVSVPGDSDSDPSHYCNPPDPGIDIEKLTNGNQADGANDGDVPEVAPGDAVTWTYVVTNTGEVPFAQSDVTVADDISGVTPVFVASSDDGDGVLSPGESWTYEATGVADDLASPSVGTVVVDGCNPDGTTVPGDRATYENVGSVSVPGDSDSDPSHYCNPPDPGIDIEKLTNGNQADGANDGDVPEVAPGDAVTWTYVVTNTGEVPFAEADVVVTDDIIGAISTIVDKGDGDGVLSPGESWTYEAVATGGAQDLADPEPGTVIVDGCNPDGTTVPGDRATYENIGTVTVPGASDEDPSHYCNVLKPGIDIEKFTKVVSVSAGGDVCESPNKEQFGKPILITMRYNGEGADASNNSQGGKSSVSGDPNGASPVFIVASKNSDGGGEVFFSGTVQLGEAFVIDGNDGGNTAFGSATFITIYASQGGPVLQRVEIHTSCSAPLIVGEQFGSLILEGLEGEDGLVVAIPQPDLGDIGEDADTPTGPQASAGDTIQWTYLVSNTGDVSLTDVVVGDDNGTPGDTSDDFAPAPVTEGGVNVGDDNGDGNLDPGEVWVYRATGTAILGQYANISDVRAVPVSGGDEVTDTDPSHYFAVFGDDICEAFEKPVTLTMRYTGDGPDATSNSQDPGKVTVSGDPNDASPVVIAVNGAVVGTVELGETFEVVVDGSNTNVVISTPGGQQLQEVDFHTSCSQPLFIGDQFGALELVDSVDTNGQGPSNPNFTGVLVETREYKDDQVKIKLKNTGSTSVAINEIEISFPSDNGLLKKVKAGTDYDPNPDLGSPALILRSDFNDPSKVIVNAGGNRDIVFEFTDKNSDPAPSDYTIVIRLDDGTVLTL